ncbi:MAG: sulfurtransferase [Chitinophagaceae bacterium]|nr:sulfurtransferase [Oligoflexus sp.]
MIHSPGFEKLVNSIRQDVKEIEAQAVVKLLENKKQPIQFIDVREESEWAAGHLPHALHISKGVIERDIEKMVPDKAAPIVLYCGGGYRSALTAVNLQLMGYTNVKSMIGGYKGWTEGKLPLTI